MDINEYFCLRIARYFHWHRDLPFLRECWPHFCRSVEFLLTLDRDGDGLPEQAPPENPLCFWADWKDVKGDCGQKAGAAFCPAVAGCAAGGHSPVAGAGVGEIRGLVQELFQRAKAQTELPVQEGGLWQGTITPSSGTMEGNFFRAPGSDRGHGLWRGGGRAGRCHLAGPLPGENEGGIPETYPFREEMEYEPGVYHNGGIWPYLTFCDCMGRYRMGAWEDAERLIRKTGRYDLEVPGDFAPNEYLHGITLQENCGFEIQGWSSALFGTTPMAPLPLRGRMS